MGETKTVITPGLRMLFFLVFRDMTRKGYCVTISRGRSQSKGYCVTISRGRSQYYCGSHLSSCGSDCGLTRFLVFGYLYRHTASNSITSETHTSGAQ